MQQEWRRGRGQKGPEVGNAKDFGFFLETFTLLSVKGN